jgi:hypothetical protein
MTPATPSSTLGSSHALLQPILRIGLFGFSKEERAALSAYLHRADGLPTWQLGEFRDADAWWINGARARRLADGTLRVPAALPTERALKLDMQQVDRPVAFARPVSSESLGSISSFDPASQSSIFRVLFKFDTLLRSVRAQYVLGARVVRYGSALRYRTYHVSSRHKLLAVLNFRSGKAGIARDLHVADLLGARWESRPPGAGEIPETFFHLTVRQLSWTYADRSARKTLPPAYHSATIYYRQVPGVPLSWVRDSQLLLLRELLFKPATMLQLRQRTGFTDERLDHDLACLYYAGAITSTRTKAYGPTGPADITPWESKKIVTRDSDVTAPALLKPATRFQAISSLGRFMREPDRGSVGGQ